MAPRHAALVWTSIGGMPAIAAQDGPIVRVWAPRLESRIADTSYRLIDGRLLGAGPAGSVWTLTEANRIRLSTSAGAWIDGPTLPARFATLWGHGEAFVLGVDQAGRLWRGDLEAWRLINPEPADAFAGDLGPAGLTVAACRGPRLTLTDPDAEATIKLPLGLDEVVRALAFADDLIGGDLLLVERGAGGLLVVDPVVGLVRPADARQGEPERLLTVLRATDGTGARNWWITASRTGHVRCRPDGATTTLEVGWLPTGGPMAFAAHGERLLVACQDPDGHVEARILPLLARLARPV